MTVEMMAVTDVEIAGLKDRLIDGILGRFVDLDGIRRGDINVIRDTARKLARLLGYEPEFTEVDDVIAEALQRDWAGVVYQLGDAMMKFSAPYMKENGPPGGIVSIAGRKPIAEMTAAECETWWLQNATRVRSESTTWAARKALRNVPEIHRALTGTATAAELAALDPEQVIKWLNRAIIVLTVATIFYPPLGVVVTALRLILVRIETRNPELGLSLTSLALL